MVWLRFWMTYFGSLFATVDVVFVKEPKISFASSEIRPRWTNWTQCFGRCSSLIQMRKCLSDHCGDNKLEIRQCSTSQNCTARKLRIVHLTDFWTQVKLEINVNKIWKPFCHSAWDIAMAHKVCRIQGFPSAEAALEGDKHVYNSSCVLNLQNPNKTCDSFEREISTSCNNRSKAVAVCKVTVLLDGSYAGIVQFWHERTLKTISVQGWNMKAAEVVCRELGFKGAIAPFSTKGSVRPLTNACIRRVDCTGNETSLSYCSLKYTSKCKGNAKVNASVTCDPKHGLTYQFRHVIVAKLGEKLNYTCSVSSGTPLWYDVSGQIIAKSQKHHHRQQLVSISANKTSLVIAIVTLNNAGVYFCNGTKHYGSLVIYVQAPFATNTIQVVKGRTKEIITCDTYGVPQPMVLPTWWKNEQRLNDGEFTPTDNSLIIQGTTIKDEGRYCCETLQVYENSAITQKLTFAVEVVGNPCQSDICLHGGSCSVNASGTFLCSCREGFTGHKCELIVGLGSEDEDSKNRITLTATVLSIICISILLLLAIIVACFLYHRRRVLAQRDAVMHESTENWAVERTPFSWEIPSQQIDLQSMLGSGTFGEVWKAAVWGLNGIPGQTTVAVKKLKHNSSPSEKESLAQEIELGRALKGDRHPNIVNFLGCVSTSEASLMLVLEYAPYGNLLGYLRKSRGLVDKFYCSSECCQPEVTPYDLLSFAQQIASGMSFLASRKILHRDLAARNILVGVGRICKITDFGLALVREKHQYLYCAAIRKGRLPIKWTAPEHLFNDSEENNVRVSEKSDVWSYGIVLYEIFTLGSLPYSGWGEWKVVYELKVNKYRMDQPDHVSDELYQIMSDCWHENPDDRPTFELLHQITTGFLQEEHYLDLDMSKYEAHLYTNVEELDAAMGHTQSLNTRGPSEEVNTMATDIQESRL